MPTHFPLQVTVSMLSRALRAAVLALLLFHYWVPATQAQTYRTWDGDQNDRWSKRRNWSPNNLPSGNTEVARFAGNNAGDNSIEIDNDQRTGGIQFDSSLTTDITFTNGANTLSIRNGGSSYGIVNNSSRTLTFENKMALEEDMTWSSTNTSGGKLDFQNSIDNAGFDLTLLTTNSNNSIDASGVISGSGALTKTGSGTLNLSGNNTYTGTTTVNGGTLQLDASDVIADSSDLVIGSGATVQFDWGAYSDTVGSLSGAGTLNLRGSAFTTSSSSNTTFSGIIADSYGSFHKAGTGDLTLTGSNTYSGITHIDGGTLVAANNAALGTSTYGNQIANGATLGLQGNINVNESSFSLEGSGDGGVGAIHNISGNNTLGASLSLTGDTTIASSSGTLSLSNQIALGSHAVTFTGSGNINASGQIGGSGGSLTKNGTGTLTLSGTSSNNSYSGATALNEGTIVLAKPANDNGGGALGQGAINIGDGIGAANSVVVRLDASPQIANYAGTTTLASDGQLDLNGYDERLNQIAGSGQITLGAGNLSVGVNSASSTYSGVVSGTGTLTKEGSGTLNLSGNNTYTGTTTVSAGTLQLGADNALSDSTAVTVASGATFDVNDHSDAVGSIAGAGSITLGSGALTAGGDNSSTTFSGVISETGSFTKAGSGTLTLSGANTYTGKTTVDGGTLFAANNAALGAASADAEVNAGGTISLDGGVTITKSSGTLTLAGTGATTATGALHAGGATGTTSQWIGDTSLDADATISAADNLLILGDDSYFGNVISLGGHTLTLNTTSANGVVPTYQPYPAYALDETNIYLTGQITGTGGLTKTGAGTAMLISFSPLNTFTGDTDIRDGKLIVDGADGDVVIPSGTVIVGDNIGAADSAALQLGQLASPPSVNSLIGTYNIGTNTASTDLRVNSDGFFDLNAASNIFKGLTVQGGHIRGQDPNLSTYYSPLLTITDGITSLASSRTAVIEDGELGMSNNHFTFDIAQGSAPGGVDLRIDQQIHNGIGYTASSATGVVEKTGTGKLVFTGPNDYQGVTEINQGVLNIQHDTALGQRGTSLGDLGNRTTVATGAQLQMEGDITVGIESLELNGTGISGTGALRNISGNNTYGGEIYLQSDSRINSDAGTLTIQNPYSLGGSIINGTSAGQNLSFGGAGDTIVNGGIASYVGDLTKDGTGTLTLAGVNGYAGATNITSGAVKVIHDHGLFGIGGTVSSGATLQFAQTAAGADVNVIGIKMTLNGTGINNGGAIQNLTGNNSFIGDMTLASDSRITADTGGSLALSGDLSGAGYNLSAGGAGDTSYSGAISGTGTQITKTDTGTITLTGTDANTFTGGLQINEATVQLNKTSGVNATGTGPVTVGDGTGAATSATLALQADNQMDDGTDLTLASDGRIQMGSATDAVSTIAGTGQIDLGTGTLSLGADNTNSTFSGSVTGTGTLQKDGTGTLTLGSDISYAGTLVLGGGTLKLADVDLTVGTVHITSNTILDFSGDSHLYAGTLTIDPGVTVSVINWAKGADGLYATTFTGGTYDAAGQGTTPQNQIIFSGWSANDTLWDSYDNQIYPNVPEPSTYGAFFLLGCCALLALRKRKAKNRS